MTALARLPSSLNQRIKPGAAGNDKGPTGMGPVGPRRGRQIFAGEISRLNFARLYACVQVIET
jgi:hypothetical protein